MVEIPAPYTSRASRVEDAEAVAAIANAQAVAAVGEPCTSAAELVGDWQSPGRDLEVTTRIVLAPDGSIVACAFLEVSERATQPYAWGEVVPAHRGQGLGGARRLGRGPRDCARGRRPGRGAHRPALGRYLARRDGADGAARGPRIRLRPALLAHGRRPRGGARAARLARRHRRAHLPPGCRRAPDVRRGDGGLPRPLGRRPAHLRAVDAPQDHRAGRPLRPGPLVPGDRGRRGRRRLALPLGVRLRPRSATSPWLWWPRGAGGAHRRRHTFAPTSGTSASTWTPRARRVRSPCTRASACGPSRASRCGRSRCPR